MVDLALAMPTLAVDPFADAVRADPFDCYRQIRDAGPVCYLEKYGVHAIARHEELKAVLANWEDFSSASGVALNDLMNSLMVGTVLASDPPDHTQLRKILGRPLAPAPLAAMRQRLRDLASAKVAELVGRGRIEAMSELAMLLPIAVVSEMVGLPEEGRERMLDWAGAAFNGMAPAGLPLSDDAFPIMGTMVDYITDPALIERLKPESWAAQLWATVEAGELSPEQFRSIIQGYVSPSLDTTIFAVGNLLWLLATNPDQWAALKADRALIPRCINESLRVESPALGFSRVARRDVEIGGLVIPQGARVVTILPSANRDERRYEDPDRFDIRRDARDHLAFGGGIHRCVGGNLAMLELTAVLEAVVEQVGSIELHGLVRADNAILRGFETLEVTLN